VNTQTQNAWARHLLAGLARTVLFTLAGLLIWSVLPIVLGWQPTVVLTGSMEPRINAGDIVVIREIPADELRPGHVLLVDDPAQQGQRLLHRYDHATDEGELVLRGDANDDVDSTPVSTDDVHGVGTLRIPWVGQPAVWAAEARYLPLGLTALGLLVLLALARIPATDENNDDDSDDDPDDDPVATPSRPETPAARPQAKPVALTGAATLLAAALVTGVGVPASATFSATTETTASFTAAEPEPTEPPPSEGFSIEAESLVGAATGTAPVEVQDTDLDWNFSGGAQLWFRATTPGDVATTTFEVPTTGLYDLSAIFTQAPDYGVVKVAIDGEEIWPPFDGFRREEVASSDPLDWGEKELEAGSHELTLTVIGKHPDSTGHLVGLDRIDFELLDSTPPAEPFQIEAETLVDASTGSAPVEAQDTWGNWGFSGGAQLWFRATEVGDTMTTSFDVPTSGTYDVSAILTQGPDYGQVQVSLNGDEIGPAFDGFRREGVATTGLLGAGYRQLDAGPHEVSLTVTGKHLDSTGYFAGIDRTDFDPQ